MNSSKRVLPLAQLCYRQFSQTATRQAGEVAPPRIQKLKEKQKKFQIDDGKPVYLKAGTSDKVLFGITCFGTLVGVGMSIETFCRLAFFK